MATWLHAGLQDGGLSQYGLHKGLSNLGLFSGASLDLRFADTKSLADAVTGQSLVTFTRASSATYVGSDGVIKTAAVNEPRFDHNPTTGESLGLLVEEQRTNLLLQSEDFATTWTLTNTTVLVNQVTAPDGLTTADKIVETATTAEHNTRQDTASQSAGTYTISIFAKAEERAVIQFASTGVLGGFRANFDLANGVLGTVDVQLTARIIPFPNGWYRCVVTATSTTAGALRAQWNIVTSATAARVESYAGDITKGLYLWGAMIEAGAFATSVIPTSYIPTTTATATRSADVASITGTNFSSWYRVDEGSLFTDCSINYTVPGTSFPLCASINDGTNNNRIENGFVTASVAGLEVIAGGVTQAAMYPNAGSTLTRRLATSFRLNDFAVSVNGGAVNTDTSGTVPAVDRLRVGDRTGGSALNGTIRRLTYFPQRLPNSTLQALTQ